MKKALLLGLLSLLILPSCEKSDNEVFLKIGSGQEYKFSDIELYDTSTHILYFKREQEFFNCTFENSFTFLNNGQAIYQGRFVPGYSNYIPDGPFIMSPPMYGNYAFKIENFVPGNQDIRDDPEMISILKQHELLHSGLSVSSGSVEITGNRLTFRFTVTNHDQSDLMIIDLNKTGPNLFHYFTNGLNIYDLAHNEVFSSNIEHQAPDPWNSFKIEWLSEIKSGDSRQFTLYYTVNNPINPGEYDTTFEFPGLAYQVTKDQLYQGNKRIWLGGVTLKKKITIK